MGAYFKEPVPRDKVKLPNPNAPRAKYSRYNTINRDLYERFVLAFPQYNIDWKTFKVLLAQSNRIIRDFFLTTREGVSFPERAGRIFIGAYERGDSKPYYDWRILQKDKLAYSHRNWESDKYCCKIFYTSFGEQYELSNKRYWYFTASDKLKKLTSDEFIKNWNYFVKIPKFQRMSNIDRLLGNQTIKIVHHEPNRRRVDFTDTQPH
jgi:hypothetical protein